LSLRVLRPKARKAQSFEFSFGSNSANGDTDKNSSGTSVSKEGGGGVSGSGGPKITRATNPKRTPVMISDNWVWRNSFIMDALFDFLTENYINFPVGIFDGS
jgi:hypothetical protein